MASMIDRLPQIDIDVDGHPLPQACARLFTGMRVQQHLSQPSQCELVFVQVDDGAVERAFALGAALRVSEREVPAALFEGRVSAIEFGYRAGRGNTISVRGYDDLMTLRNRQRVRAHMALTVADLARELVADLGLRVEAPTPGPVWQRLLQTSSDFDVLADVAARCGLHFTIRERTLNLLTLEGVGELQMLRLNENLLEATIEANSNRSCRRVEATGWDPWRGEARSGTAERARTAREVNIDAPASRIGGTDDRTLVAGAFQDDGQAEAAAQADLDWRAAHEVVFRGVASGNPQLRPGSRVQVAGVAASVAGIHVLASALHTLDPDEGYRSEISSALPEPPVRDRGTTMTIGRVTRVDDPQTLGRVQVSMPAYDDIESNWLQILAPGAGSGKGLVAPLDIGDLVLLLLEAQDPAQSLVLGSLYGDRGLPEGHDVRGKGASFTFLSPGGQRICLDDAKRTLRLQNDTGSSVEMSAEKMTLRSAVPLTIEAPGQKLTFRAQFIDFDRA